MRKIVQLLSLSILLPAISIAQESGVINERLAYNVQPASSTEVFTFSGSGQDDQVVFYPNPVKDILNVKFPVKGTHTVYIYNILGEKITDKTVYDADIVRIDLSGLPKGMYFLSYEASPGNVVTKTFSKSQ
ncbi:MAG: T9SS type A sorting domain-containing protein [Bacteroidota bacterium]|nr:T9SS type A sorting domain-containing protein [Bacteroidota bacterium]